MTRARGDAGVPAVLRSKIEKAIESIGEVEHHKKTHKKGPGPVAARCLPPEGAALLPAKFDQYKPAHPARAISRTSAASLKGSSSHHRKRCVPRSSRSSRLGCPAPPTLRISRPPAGGELPARKALCPAKFVKFRPTQPRARNIANIAAASWRRAPSTGSAVSRIESHRQRCVRRFKPARPRAPQLRKLRGGQLEGWG